jgi:CRP-like cAMP-binding protein
LGPGDYFGELAALIRIKRIATVVSTEDTLLASIKRHDFRSFMTIMPDVRFAMDKVVKEHLLYKYSKVGTRFFSSSAGGAAELASSLSPSSPKTAGGGAGAATNASGANAATSRRPAFYTLCEVEDVDADRILFYEHDAPGPIYFLAEGQVRLFRKEEHDGVVQHQSILLTAGSLVGARAVVLNEPQQYTAVTDQVCVFLKLGPAATAQHFADHPEVKATLEILFKERAMPLAKLLECQEAHKAFATHLKEEFNEEHLVFYDDVLLFEKLMAPAQQQQQQQKQQQKQGQEKAVAAVNIDVAASTAKLEHIQQNHLASSAPSPLNIPDAMRRRFLTAYELKEEKETELARLRRLSLALEEVKREVQALLERDNYARFKNSEAFTQLLHTLQSVMPTEPGKGGGGGGGSAGAGGGAMAGVVTAAAGANNKKSSGSGRSRPMSSSGGGKK